MSKRRGRLLFVNKKKQKTFLTWAVLVSLPRSQANKSFLRRFFSKKRHLPCAHLNLSCSRNPLQVTWNPFQNGSFWSIQTVLKPVDIALPSICGTMPVSEPICAEAKTVPVKRLPM